MIKDENLAENCTFALSIFIETKRIKQKLFVCETFSALISMIIFEQLTNITVTIHQPAVESIINADINSQDQGPWKNIAISVGEAFVVQAIDATTSPLM